MRPKVSYAILCDGVFPTNPDVRDRLLSCDVVVCCDGAARHFMKFRKPEFVVGDMDSLSEEEREQISDLIYRVEEQESNDLSKAFSWICSMLRIGKGHSIPKFTITVFGATGKREDHSIGNISLLADFGFMLDSHGLNGVVSMVTDYGTFVPVNRSCEFVLPVSQPLSIFAFDESLRISSEGLAFPTGNVRFDMWWKATLNTVSAEKVRLDFSHPAKALVYLPGYFSDKVKCTLL